MNYEILTIPPFDRQLKRLARKYSSLKQEYALLLQNLSENPIQGTPLGNNCYKIRLSIASKGKGKSGGARVITNVFVSDEKVFLLSIYDKNEQENISDRELKMLLSEVE